MPTQTSTPTLPTVAEAEAAQDELLADIAEGRRPIDVMELVKAEGTIKAAQLGEEATARRMAHQAEETRLAAVDEVRTAARAIDTEQLPRLYHQAIAAMQALVDASDTYQRESADISRRLGRLQPYPADATVDGREHDRRREATELAGVPLHAKGFTGPLHAILVRSVIARGVPAGVVSPSDTRGADAHARKIVARLLRAGETDATGDEDDAA